MPTKRARLTESPEDILAGKPCHCSACVRDGQHEPDCAVHDEPPGECGCGRSDAAKGAG